MRTYLSLFLTLLFFSCSQRTLPPEPYGALPSDRQLAWHEMETYCLIHFTPTTFQDKEWGYGDADPEIFNPEKFDANQIAEAAKLAGFKGLIIVAKHHDGFCLWPTETTDYSVASSPWKDGKGDMVKDFMEASHANDLKFGVYLSAWDRNDTRYGTPEYADAYRVQLKELMTNYGELFTSWHDGANGGDGYYGGLNEKRIIDRSTYYQWHEKTWPIVRKHQPMAMIFSDIGPDMRWVGNESGKADETSWATFTPKGIDGRQPVPGDSDYSNAPTGDRNGKFWIPAECDVPLRPGWFYHASQDGEVKSPDDLFDIYVSSVGRGGAMNLGLAPMPNGLLHDIDVEHLKGFGEKVKRTFATDLMQGAKLTASNVRGNRNSLYGTDLLVDGDRYSYWATDDDHTQGTLEIELEKTQEFDLIRLRENIKLGQRIDSVNVFVWADENWKEVAQATSIGANRIIKLEQPIEASKLKLEIFSPVSIALSEVAIFKEAASSNGQLNKELNILSAEHMEVREKGNDKFIEKLTDGKEDTNWEGSKSKTAIDIKLDEPVALVGAGLLPRQDGKSEGTPTHFRLMGSADGEHWFEISSGELSNIKNNPTWQRLFFEGKKMRYLRFISERTISDAPLVLSEIQIYLADQEGGSSL